MKTKKIDPNQAVADHWDVDIRTVRNWVRQGAPLGDEDKMIHWLSSRKNVAKGVLKKIRPHTQEKIVSAPNTDGTRGAAAALARLEEQEHHLYLEMLSAKAGGDPLAYREKRKAWLDCVESLRKYDLAVSAERRAGMDLIPITEFEKFARRLIGGMSAAIQQRADNLSSEIAGKPQFVAYELIRQSIDASMLAAGLGYAKTGGPKESRPDPRICAHVERAVTEHYSWKFDASFRADVEQGVVELIQWAFGQP